MPASNSGYKRGEYTASLDRIDSRGHYEVGNVQWIHKDLNIMKNSYDANYFIDMCKSVAKFNQGK